MLAQPSVDIGIPFTYIQNDTGVESLDPLMHKRLRSAAVTPEMSLIPVGNFLVLLGCGFVPHMQ